MNTLGNRFITLALAGLGLVAGCGTDHSPTAQDGATQAPRERIVLQFSPEAGAAKAAGIADYGSQTRIITPIGGTIRIGEMEDDEDALGARFTVPSGALSKAEAITMGLYGKELNSLVVDFAPGGLEFLKSASLEFTLGEDRVDVPGETLEVWHIYEDGNAEQAAVNAVPEQDDASLAIQVAVDGFSRYGLRDR